MATLKELRDERLRKLEELTQLGVNAYPAQSNRTHGLDYITNNFDELENQTVTVTGRIKSIRKFGKIAFVVIKDWSGSLQMFWKADVDQTQDYANSELGLQNIALLDAGDFVEVTGHGYKNSNRRNFGGGDHATFTYQIPTADADRTRRLYQ